MMHAATQHETASTWRREFLAGTTTFATMAYIIVVNPKILEAAGIPFGASMVATIVSAAFGTLLMGVYANRPFAIAPYMGQNAFIAYTVVGRMGHSWETALGAVFVSGAVFTVFSIFGIRKWLAESIPDNLKRAFAVGIGLFLAMIGLATVGIVAPGAGGVPVRVGDLSEPSVMLATAGFVLIVALLVRRVPGAILIGILAAALAAMATGLAPIPEAVVSTPPSLGPTLLQLLLVVEFFPFIHFDSIPNIVNVLPQHGRLPGMGRALQCDALATVAGSLLGTTTCGTYIESAAGIEAGGRTGRTAVVTAGWFLAALFFAPILSAVPAAAYGPALIVVGMIMVEPAAGLEYRDLTELAPAFITLALMAFTYDLGIGLTAGFVSYAVFKTLSGRAREVSNGMWVLAALSALFYAFYPY
jgi:AGZA family xanthine/uracil permease-like MFS transporter